MVCGGDGHLCVWYNGHNPYVGCVTRRDVLVLETREMMVERRVDQT